MTAVVALLLLPQVACASTGHKAVFYTSRASYTVTLDLSGIEQVVLRSSLPQEKVTVTLVPSRGSLSGVMQYSIGGYHGSRKDAGVGPVPRGAMVFDEKRDGATLILSSREWVYMHHAMLYTMLTIAVPKRVTVVVEPYSHEELTARGSK